MKLLKIIAFVIGSIISLTIYGKFRQHVAASQEKAAALAKDPGLSPQGFWLVKRGMELTKVVTVMIPANCPSADAARARALIASVREAGIPCEPQAALELKFDNPDDFDRVKKYTEKPSPPLVIVKGWAKGNPTAAEVIAQYRGTT